MCLMLSCFDNASSFRFAPKQSLSHESVPRVALPESVKIDGFLKTESLISLEASPPGQIFFSHVQLSELKYSILNMHPADNGDHGGDCPYGILGSGHTGAVVTAP